MPGTELQDGFFEQEEIKDEETFKQEFDTPAPFDQGIDTTGGEEGAGKDGAEADGKGTNTGDGDGDSAGEEVDFKFDDAVAQEEKKELEELNQKLDSNFETMDAFRKAISQNENKEKVNDIEKEKQYINYFQELVDSKKYSDEDLVREDKRIEAFNANKDLKDEEVKVKIEEEIEMLKDSGYLSYAARNVRDNYNNKLKESKSIVKNFEDSKILSKEQKEKKFKNELQEGISEIFKEGKFMGIKPTKEILLDVYKEVSKNKHIEHLKAHPKDAVEFALFKRYKEVLLKNLGKPDFNAGVKNTLKELGMSGSEQTGKTGEGNPNTSDEDDSTYLEKFVK